MTIFTSDRQSSDWSSLENEDWVTTIQPHGLLLVLDPPDLNILQVSKNIAQVLGWQATDLLGKPLNTVLQEDGVDLVKHLQLEPTLGHRRPIPLSLIPLSPTVPADGVPLPFQGYLHQSLGGLVLELEPIALDQESTAQANGLTLYHRVQETLDRLRGSHSFAQAGDQLVQAVRDLTGYDRVMVYRFETDGSGIVAAEAKREDLEPYLGLHYPAVDIPPLARKKFSQQWTRLIPNADVEPVSLVPAENPHTGEKLDLGNMVLTGVSACHRQYLKNMGVAASLSISLIDDRRLWGLLACHHTTPMGLNFEIRQACEFLGRFMSIELVRQFQQDLEKYQANIRQLQGQLQHPLLDDSDGIMAVLHRQGAKLQNLVNATGAALCFQDQLVLLGQTPTIAQVKPLLTWLMDQAPQSEPFHTNHLSQVYPPAQDYVAQASGLLAVSIVVDDIAYRILWFRPEVAQTVVWAGNPAEAVVQKQEDDRSYLSPRDSFTRWQETVQGKSLPWLPVELEAAQALQNTLMLAALKFSQAALEAEAHRAEEASKAKSEFLANISHEIRTPMNAILGFCDLLTGLVNEPRQIEYLDAIATSGRSLLALINDILDLSKIEAGKLEIRNEPISLKSILREIKQIFSQAAREKDLQLAIDIDLDLPEAIYLDEVRLRQILFNIVGNAIKFTPQGFVRITVRSTPDPKVVDQIALEIIVQDSGIGISSDQQTRIFEAFTQSEGQSTRRYGGTGLGLAITQRLMELLDGHITVESAPNEGTLFKLSWPAVRLAQVSDTCDLYFPPSNQSLDQFQPAVILIADDVESNRKLLQGYFANTQHTLLFAEDGEKALELIQAHHPDLILLDLWMPNLGGREVLIQTRNWPEFAQTPIVLLTASVNPADYLDLKSLCDGFLQKPVSKPQLIAALQGVLPRVDRVSDPKLGESPKGLPGQPHPIFPEVETELTELLLLLTQTEATTWQTLDQFLKMRDLRAFSAQLQQWCEMFSYAPLQNYTDRLIQQMKTFDWDTLPKTVAEFPQLRRTLANALGQ